MKKLFMYYILLNGTMSFAQQWNVTEMATMPKHVSNNAVTEGTVSGAPYVFSFGGIDSTKNYSGINLNSFRYNTITNVWEQIANLPDTLGKIASSASTVKNKIYIIGGYHVFSSGAEISSNKVHVYDPESNIFLPDATNIPVPIDDHVQCVWRDSLIYVITGWSNTTNVPNVQIFNPSDNSWIAGTPVINTSVYKVFGGSGVIVGDTIFYYGGATTGINFPAQKNLRMGIIDPLNPTNITWSSPSLYLNDYRCASTTDSLGNVYFLGGSPVTYNYNGIAYNGSGGVNPNLDYYYFNTSNTSAWNSASIILPMDLRGIANISPSIKYIVGGMELGQNVSNKTLKLQLSSNIGVNELNIKKEKLVVYPNPSNGIYQIDLSNNENIVKIECYNLSGIKVYSIEVNSKKCTIDLKELKKGSYIIKVYSLSQEYQKSIIRN